MNLTNAIIMYNFNNVGNLQSGNRPAYVIKEYDNCLLVAPVTSKIKNNLPTHHVIRNYLYVDSVVLCEQLFVVNKSDITNDDKTICYLSISDRLAITRKLKVSLGLTDLTSVNVVTEFQNKSFIDNEHVVIQNDYGNVYSPTTIVGYLANNDVKSIYTENKQKNMINKCFVNFKGIGTKIRKYLMIREDFQYITC